MEPKQNALLAAFAMILTPAFLNGFYNDYLYQSPTLYWITEPFFWVLLPGGILYYLFKKGHLSFAELGLAIPKSGSEILLVIAAVVLAVVATPFLYQEAWQFARRNFGENLLYQEFQYVKIIPESHTLKIVVAFYFALSAGIVEELFFRSMPRRIFSSGALQSIFYVLSTTALFTIVHWEGGIYSMFSAAVLGTVFASMYLYTKNIYPCIIGHAYVNWTIFSA